VISLTYDREISGEDERARACYQNLVEALTAKGYVPYRLGIQSMELICLNAPAAALVQALKQAVDSAHILAPRRYEATKM
jgi:4-cresol dehydrogenase (hydroxylating)